MEKAGNKDTSDEVERKGIGTPATRAGIIEKLVQIGFAERKDKTIVTQNGNLLISVLPETLVSSSLTAEWENKLSLITKGLMTPKEFMDGINSMITELVKRYPVLSNSQPNIFSEKDISR